MKIIRDDKDYLLMIKERPEGSISVNGPRVNIGLGFCWSTREVKKIENIRNQVKIKNILIEWAEK